MKKWLIEKLNTSHHQREGFDCGVPVLNHYLQTRARQEQQKRLNLTYVAIAEGVSKPQPILGYYTLSNSALAHAASAPSLLTKGVPPTYDIPSVKIGRLAVDRQTQGTGLGGLLLRSALHQIVELSALSGVRAIEVVAKNAHSEAFYRKYGFMPFESHHKTDQQLLCLPIQTAIQALNRAAELA